MIISSIKNEFFKFNYKNNIYPKVLSFKSINCSEDFNEYDKINASHQYFNQYLISPNLPDKNKIYYDKILSNLNTNNDFNEQWLNQNKQFFQDLYCIDFSMTDSQHLKSFCLNEIKNKKPLVLDNLNNKYYKEKIKFYQNNFSNLKNLNYKNLHELNYINLLPLNYINPQQKSNVFIDKYNLFTNAELKRMTNFNIVCMPHNVELNNFKNYINEQILNSKNHYNLKKQNTILIINNLYKYINEDSSNLEFIKNIINKQENTTSDKSNIIFLLKESNHTQLSLSPITEKNIYHEQTAQLMDEIIKPIKNNNLPLKKIFILTGNHKTTTKTLLSICNTLPNQVTTIPANTRTTNFPKALLSAINQAKENYSYDKKKTLIAINLPYIFDLSSENKKLLNQIINDKNQSYALILNNYIPQNLKTPNNINNATVISYPKLSNESVEKIFKQQIEKIQENIEEDFDIFSQKFKINSNLIKNFDIEDIQEILLNTQKLYLKSGKYNFYEILLNELDKYNLHLKDK